MLLQKARIVSAKRSLDSPVLSSRATRSRILRRRFACAFTANICFAEGPVRMASRSRFGSLGKVMYRRRLVADLPNACSRPRVEHPRLLRSSSLWWLDTVDLLPVAGEFGEQPLHFGIRYGSPDLSCDRTPRHPRRTLTGESCMIEKAAESLPIWMILSTAFGFLTGEVCGDYHRHRKMPPASQRRTSRPAPGSHAGHHVNPARPEGTTGCHQRLTQASAGCLKRPRKKSPKIKGRISPIRLFQNL